MDIQPFCCFFRWLYSLLFNWILEQKNIELVMDVESNVVDIDATSISQVMSNLLDNAIRYYEGTDPITIKGEKLSKAYKVSITGPGRSIIKVERKRIFERLYRTESSKSQAKGGTGLGLAISKEIIERHHGEISLHSDGSTHTFWFTLP